MSNERLKMIFGFCMLVVLTALAIIIGLGKVEQQTSHGLDIILGSLATLSGMFAQWAFGKSPENSGSLPLEAANKHSVL